MAFRRFSLSVAIILALACVTPAVEGRRIVLPPPRFKFDIDPATPVADLLPTVPKKIANLPPFLNEDLALVPEVSLGEPVSKDLERGKAMEATAFIIAKINLLNQKKEDGFLHALIARRPDLRGLPFLMGQACRTDAPRAALFAEVTRAVQNGKHGVTSPATRFDEREPVEKIWQSIHKHLSFNTDSDSRRSNSSKDDIRLARLGALGQMFPAAGEHQRAGIAEYIGTIQHAEATRVLARLALFAPEESLRTEAIAALKARPSAEYVDILMQGFRYPLPAVAQRAANALIKLDCQGAAADLVRVLDEPDPRAPHRQVIDGKQATVVRELVRVNHLHNCLLCHAPANVGDVPRDALRAPVPLPGQPLGSLSLGGYSGNRVSPDIFVRIDMTYLRQDFSMLMKVADAAPWPEMQRFDFLLRTRMVTPDEAAACEKQLDKQGTPPHHQAAILALRTLTGHTPTEKTAAAWRAAIGLEK